MEEQNTKMDKAWFLPCRNLQYVDETFSQPELKKGFGGTRWRTVGPALERHRSLQMLSDLPLECKVLAVASDRSVMRPWGLDAEG